MGLTSAAVSKPETYNSSLTGTASLDRSAPLDVRQAAAYLRIAPSTLYKVVGAGAVAYSKPGGKHLLFLQEDLDAYVRRHRREALQVVAEQREEMHAVARLRGRRTRA